MINVGVVGYGYAARTFHIPLLEHCGGMRLAAVSSSRAEAVRADRPSLRVFGTPEAMIASDSVDLVVITAPNAVHFPLARQCLENGKHVVVEKPMTTSSDEARTLVTLAARKALMLSVFHNRRWDGDFLTLRSLVRGGAVGEPRYFESRFDRFRPEVRQRWREQPGRGNGIWFDLGPHLVDQATQLFGLPEAVTARCLALREDSQTTDYFHVQLHYPRLEVVLHASPFHPASTCRFRLEGADGCFIKYGLDPQEAQLKEGMDPGDATFGLEDSADSGNLFLAEGERRIPSRVGRYSHFYGALADAIRSGRGNPVPGEEVIETIELLELAEASSRLGKSLPYAIGPAVHVE